MVSLALMPLRSYSFDARGASRSQADRGAGLVAHQFRIEMDVVTSHAPGGKEFLDVSAYGPRLDFQFTSTLREFTDLVANMTAHTFLNHLRDRTAGHSQDRCAASHGFDHHQAEGFVPLHRKEHGQRIPQ